MYRLPPGAVYVPGQGPRGEYPGFPPDMMMDRRAMLGGLHPRMMMGPDMMMGPGVMLPVRGRRASMGLVPMDMGMMDMPMLDPRMLGRGRRRSMMMGMPQQIYQRGRVDGYAEAIEDVNGLARLEKFQQGHAHRSGHVEEMEEAPRKEKHVVKTSGGTVITQDAHEKYLAHKAAGRKTKANEYAGLLEAGPEGHAKKPSRNKREDDERSASSRRTRRSERSTSVSSSSGRSRHERMEEPDHRQQAIDEWNMRQQLARQQREQEERRAPGPRGGPPGLTPQEQQRWAAEMMRREMEAHHLEDEGEEEEEEVMMHRQARRTRPAAPREGRMHPEDAEEMMRHQRPRFARAPPMAPNGPPSRRSQQAMPLNMREDRW